MLRAEIGTHDMKQLPVLLAACYSLNWILPLYGDGLPDVKHKICVNPLSERKLTDKVFLSLPPQNWFGESSTAENNAQVYPASLALPSLTTLPTTTVDNAPINIATKAGWKVVYFWSTECPCVKACEEYSLRPLAQKYAGKVKFYGVVSGSYDLKKPQAELVAAIQNRHLPYPVLFA